MKLSSDIKTELQELTANWPFKRWAQYSLAAGFVVVALNLGLAAALAGRIYPGIKVADHNLGGLTRPAARQMLQSTSQNYRLTLKVAGQTYDLTPEQIGTNYDIETTLDQAFMAGRSHAWPLWGLVDIWRHNHLVYAYEVDRNILGQFVTQIAKASTSPAVDARVVISNGQIQVQPDQPGKVVDRAELSSKIGVALASFSQQPIVMDPAVVQATVQARDTADAVAQAKQILDLPISLTYNGQAYRPTDTDVGNWVAFKADGDHKLIAYIDTGRVKTYLQILAEKLNVAAVNKKVSVANGVTTVTQEGKDGTAIDQDPAVNAIAKALDARQGLAYQLTSHAVPFKTDTTQQLSLAGGRYIEASLALQHLWVYDNSQVVFDSPLTSGATGAGFPTPTGLFAIYYKTTNFWMDGHHLGYNYYVHVDFWMPFYKDYGLHDASWRSSFGGQDYYYNGSHGCINLPWATAAWLYNWSTVGTPVWVHL